MEDSMISEEEEFPKPKSAIQAARSINALKKGKKVTKTTLSKPVTIESDDLLDENISSYSKLPDIHNIDFVNTNSLSAKDMREIEERTAQNEDNILTTVKLYKRNHIQHLFRFADDPLKPCGKPYADYPRTSDKKCLYCHKKISKVGTGIPIFAPYRYDKQRSVFILTRDPYCSKPGHAKLSILFRARSNTAQQITLLGWFLREFLGFPIESITSVPLSARADFSYYGTMTEEQYEEAEQKVTVVVKEPPALFVETFLEQHDIQKKEEDRKKIFHKLHSIRATPQQQLNFKENTLRVVKEAQKSNSGIENSPIAKKMSIKSKDS